MADKFELCIPPCISSPAHAFHSPPPDTPLRLQIEGPVVAIENFLPGIPWQTDVRSLRFPQRVGPALARLAYRTVYERNACPDLEHDIVVRDEYLN